MFIMTRSELAPTEDQSILFFQATAPQTATIEYDEAYVPQIVKAFETVPEYEESFFLIGSGRAHHDLRRPQDAAAVAARALPDAEVQPEVQAKLEPDRRAADRGVSRCPACPAPAAVCRCSS